MYQQVCESEYLIVLTSGYQILALLKAQICMISFQTYTQIFGIWYFIKHSYMLKDRTLSDFLLAVCCYKSPYMYEYIIETETPLSELKISPNYKET